MQPAQSNIEQELCETLDRELRYYSEAAVIAEQLREEFREGQSTVSRLKQLGQLLDGVSQLNVSGRAIKEQWKELGNRPGPGLNKRLVDVREQLTALIATVGQCEQFATAAQQRLAPKMSHESQSLSMRRAYRNVVDNC